METVRTKNLRLFNEKLRQWQRTQLEREANPQQTTKRCGKCGETFPGTPEYFYRDKSRKDGLRYECKECTNERNRQWAQANPERNREYSRQWHQANPEWVHKYKRQWNQANPERNREYTRQWKQANPEWVRQWREAPQHRFLISFTSHISTSLNGSRNRRRWSDLLGYSRQDLLGHIESQFADGMNWDSYGYGPGKWCLHHVRPVSTFSFDSPEDQQFKECWALENLQPLWWEDHVAVHAEMRAWEQFGNFLDKALYKGREVALVK